MRMLLKVQIPNERGNQLVREGKLGATLQAILGEIKPEAAYFYAQNGERTGLLVVDLPQAADIPRLAEPFFLALGAKIDMLPCMLPADLAQAESDLRRAAKTFGQ
jgi:hypothetical protein